jgi:uncharacterized membrane protein YkvA (DUF1232 family)
VLSIAIGVVAGLILAWLGLLLVLAIVRPDGATLVDTVSVVPDTIRLVLRLARDPLVPRSVRVTLFLLGAYLLSPVDLVPDFIPVVGYADDAVIASLALRRVVRAAGSDALDRHWTGSPAGLELVRRLAGLP